MEAALDGVQTALLIFDRELRYLALNTHAGVLLGRESASLIGRMHLTEFPEAAGGDFHQGCLRALETNEPQVARTMDGPWPRHLEHRICPTVDGLAVLSSPVRADQPAALAGIDEAEYLRAVLDAAPICIKVVARDGRLLDMNAAGLRILGVSGIDAVRGTDVSRIVAVEDRPTFRAATNAALHGESRAVMCRITTQSGAQRHMEARTAPLRGLDGNVFATLSVTEDVTERQRAAAQLRESEARYRTLVDTAHEGICATDADGLITYANPCLASLIGCAVADLIGRSFADLLFTEDVAAARTRFARLRAGAVDSREATLRRTDGSLTWVWASGCVLAGDDGTRRGLLFILGDRTEQRQLEERLRQTQKMEALGQLAAGVAHDFNNLLTVIVGNLQLASDDLPAGIAADHPVRDSHREIGLAAERARTLVRQLLLFSRQQPVHRQLLRVGDAVRGAEKLLRRVIGEEIALTTTIHDDSLQVLADLGQLEQVLMNLAVNARDAMLTPMYGHAGTGGALEIVVDRVEIDANVAREWGGAAPGAWARLRVRDNGHGMDADTRARVFEPFFTTKPVGFGTGLGLSTVFGIVERAGGTIRIDSAPRRGTTISVLLPIAHGGPDVEETASSPSAFRAATVLLVEDEDGVRRTTRRILERRGYAVLEARHGVDALRLWHAHGAGIDVLVTDLRMPEMGGRELVAHLRADRRDLPAVLMSGYRSQLDTLAMKANEAYVDKPFTADVLCGTVGALLSSSNRSI